MDIFKGPSQIEEALAAYISKVQTIENMNYTIGHISPEWVHLFREWSVVLDSLIYELCEGSAILFVLCLGQNG